jgi:hypothetical protein
MYTNPLSSLSHAGMSSCHAVLCAAMLPHHEALPAASKVLLPRHVSEEVCRHRGPHHPLQAERHLLLLKNIAHKASAPTSPLVCKETALSHSDVTWGHLRVEFELNLNPTSRERESSYPPCHDMHCILTEGRDSDDTVPSVHSFKTACTIPNIPLMYNAIWWRKKRGAGE